MTLLEAMAVQSRIAMVEEAVSRLLASIENGAAPVNAAEFYTAALRRPGGTILRKWWPETPDGRHGPPERNSWPWSRSAFGAR